jgi:CHAT domain-containing protein
MDEMQHCQLPEMQYTLMTVIAEYYEDIGDAHQVLHWRQKANAVAQDVDDEDIKREAECAFRVALADETVHVLDDPYGVKQAGWKLAQTKDLEHLFYEAEGRNDWQRCFVYAWKLLEKELDQERLSGRPPVGKHWHSKIEESLQRLDDDKRIYEQPRISFTVAHAKFEAGHFHECISMLAEVAEKCLGLGNKETASRAFFTTSRAFLELFRTSTDIGDWNNAVAALTKCQILSEEQERPDMVACCHVLHATAWHARRRDSADALARSLESISNAQNIWSAERLNVTRDAGIDSLLTHYAMTGRNAKTPYSVYGLAAEICFELGRPREAFLWAECSKAQAFRDSLQSNDLAMNDQAAIVPGHEGLLFPATQEPTLLVHWVMNGETVYMCTCRNGNEYRIFKLEITASAVEEWHQSLVATKDNLSDAESAAEILAELRPLCQPLLDIAVAKPGDLLILCPTKVLFRVPIHAIPLEDGSTLLERHLIVYTHSFSVMNKCMSRRQCRRERSRADMTIIGNATGDTPGGEASAHEIATHQKVDCFTRQQATKQQFLDRAPQSQLVHVHGHVFLDAYPLDQSMRFHQHQSVKAREVFSLSLEASHPVVVLIGCGSGVERLDAGDEPLGLVSGFLHAGASTVVATMWPIHDQLSGAAFSKSFYGLDSEDASTWESGRTVDLAGRLQRAALSIKAREETRAPYFWAGFVLHGDWKWCLD